MFSFWLCFVYLLSFQHIPGPASALPTSRFSHAVQTLTGRDTSDHVSTTIYEHPAQDIRSTRLQRRGVPGAVYICTEDNFRGDCAWTAPNDRCHIVGTGDNSPKSIGPDEDGFCELFEKATCTGARVKTLRFPGQASNMPTFMGLICHPDRPASGNMTRLFNGTTPTLLNDDDPRLSGGVGSAERKQLEDVMENMEKHGFKEGMIGLKKGHYY